MTEAHIELAKAGVPIFVLPMPQMGTTGPMSVLGTSCQHGRAAAAVVLFQLAEPGCAIVSGVGSAVAEMRSGLYLAGAPEVALINVICIEMSKFYGIRTMGSGVTADAKALQPAGGRRGHDDRPRVRHGRLPTCILAFGLLDGAQMASLAKAVLDDDTVGAIRRFLREDPVDASRRCSKTSRTSGIGGHYLAPASTRRFYRAGELWQPEVWQRAPFETYAGSTLVRGRRRGPRRSSPPNEVAAARRRAWRRRRRDRRLPGDKD